MTVINAQPHFPGPPLGQPVTVRAPSGDLPGTMLGFPHDGLATVQLADGRVVKVRVDEGPET